MDPDGNSGGTAEGGEGEGGALVGAVLTCM